MRVVFALLLALASALPALAEVPPPHVRTCGTSQFGDLGEGWRDRAVVAGHIAFLGPLSGRGLVEPAPAGRVWPIKVLVVVDGNAAPTVTISARSRAYAALGYNAIRHDGRGVPLAQGTTSVRFVACHPFRGRESWNRGTQFGGYFLVAGPRCVHVEIASAGTVFRRALRFGVARCG